MLTGPDWHVLPFSVYGTFNTMYNSGVHSAPYERIIPRCGICRTPPAHSYVPNFLQLLTITVDPQTDLADPKIIIIQKNTPDLLFRSPLRV